MESDAFATACKNNHSGNLTISIYNSPIIPPINRFEIITDDNNFSLKDLVYNPMYTTIHSLIRYSDDTYGLLSTANPFYSHTKEKSTLRRWLSIDNAD